MGSPFSLEFEGLAEIEAKWKRGIVDRVVVGSQIAVMRAALAGAALARQLVPVGPRGGEHTNEGPHLRDKIFAVLVRSTLDESGAFKSVAADIKADTNYASFVENGTRPHEIRPRRAGVLAWENPGAQRDYVFARVVHHPGTKPHPFMGPAYLQAERELERQVTMVVDKAADDFNRD